MIHHAQARHTKVIYAQAQLVMPGFNDAHVHFLGGAFQPVNEKGGITRGKLADLVILSHDIFTIDRTRSST